MLTKRWDRAMRSWLLALIVVAAFTGGAFAQEDKKTDDLKPADPDTGGSTVEEATLGLLPTPFEKQGIKFAVTYIGEVLGNPTGGAKQGAAYEDRINFAADVYHRKPVPHVRLNGAGKFALYSGLERVEDRTLAAGV
jgi:porin